MERTQHTPSRREMLRAYCSPVLLAIAMLGFASGLPLALTAATLSAWLADAQVNMQTIGLFASVASPYAFKFLWAPLLDGLHLSWLTARLGRRRSWMLLLQAILALLLLALSQQNPAEHPWHVAMLAFAIAVASASQDIVIDAYRTERLSPEQLGPGIAMSTLGYPRCDAGFGRGVACTGTVVWLAGGLWQHGRADGCVHRHHTLAA